MSSVIQHLFEQKYNTWGDALGEYLDERFGKRGSRSKLARMLLDDEASDSKIKSKASEIGRWINQGVTPIDRTRKEVHNLLNICITENNQGFWEISHTNKNKPSDEQSAINDSDKSYDINNLDDQARQIVHLLQSDKVGEPSRDDRIRALELAQTMIRFAIESLKKESSD